MEYVLAIISVTLLWIVLGSIGVIVYFGIRVTMLSDMTVAGIDRCCNILSEEMKKDKEFIPPKAVVRLPRGLWLVKTGIMWPEMLGLINRSLTRATKRINDNDA